MNTRFAHQARVVFSYILIITSTLLVASVLAFLSLSAYGTHMKNALADQANELFGEEWMAHQTVPPHLPVQQILVIDENGDIELCFPPRSGLVVSSLEDNRQTTEGGLVEQVTAHLGLMLDPLVDRYPYIGRSPTFLIRSYPQRDNGTVIVALWLPLVTRLIWTTYSGLIYLYLIHWLISVVWVYLDTRVRQIYPWKWTMFTVVANIVGLITYLIVRRKRRTTGL